ncbi:hypothetical protein B0T12DRAFT_57990 [Alternaria alternata]|nr:hypothetical protein B0T12DRAFT_57990 [Alternaria alternata]
MCRTATKGRALTKGDKRRTTASTNNRRELRSSMWHFGKTPIPGRSVAKPQMSQKEIVLVSLLLTKLPPMPAADLQSSCAPILLKARSRSPSIGIVRLFRGTAGLARLG